MKKFVADFETTVEVPTRVWMWGYAEIGNVDNFVYGANIDEFMDWCKTENKLIFFHNLKFDGDFIFHWLLTNGFTYDKEGTKESKTFNCIISKEGAFYQIEIIFEKMKRKYKKVVIQDSHKKLPFPAGKIGKAFKLDYQKVEVEEEFYTRPRGLDHVFTQEEIEYMEGDVKTIATALHIQFEQGLDKMTVGSDALSSFKTVLGGGDIKKGKKIFERNFPVLPLKVDKDIRQSYRGGYTFVNGIFCGVDINAGIVYDVNSLYPSVMYDKPVPFGVPIPFKGKYKPDELYPLYIQRFECEFKLKEGYLPMIQKKNGGRFVQTEYLTSNIDKAGFDDPVELVLTNVDLELFFEHYDVDMDTIEWLDGYKFRQCEGIFCEYIDHWTKVKIANAKEKNALYQLAKLMLNSLYGKFASNPDVTGRFPVLNDDGSIGYDEKPKETKDPVYTAVACFITAWARDKTIRTAQKVYDRFIYADTDSIHLLGTDEPEGIDVHDSDLGKWACEGTFTRARFIRAKTYIEEINGKLEVTCAGMPDNVKEFVTWDNFHRVADSDEVKRAKKLNKGNDKPIEGTGIFYGKKVPHHVEGGIVLKNDYFTIN